MEVLKKLTIDSETTLIDRCINGESLAQVRLYQKYAPVMLNVAYRILNNREDAKDVLQDAFVKAFSNLGQLKNKSGFYSWLKKIVVHTAVNFAKRKGLLKVELTAAIETQYTIQDTEPVSFDINIVRKALMMLPTGYRTVLTLYLIEGYDHEEIAQILDISKSTSLTQYARGKAKLKVFIHKSMLGV